MDALEDLIAESLREFTAFIIRTDWRGREREAVSLYAFGFLVPRCHPDGVLREPTQIGLDVAVPQVPGPDRKALVCKDLVLWPEPAGTCWGRAGATTHRPIAILEWKARTDSISLYDERWLQEFSEESPTFVGFAISIHPRGTGTTLTASRVKGGVVTHDWLRLPESGDAVEPRVAADGAAPRR